METNSSSVGSVMDTSGERSLSPDFFYEEGNVIILVVDTLYSIPRHLLKESPLFQTLLSLDPGPDSVVEGLTREHPLDLSKADPSLKKADFDVFQRALCTPAHRKVRWSINALKSALQLAHKWEFTRVERYLIELLRKEPLPAADSIEIGATYHLDKFLLQGYIAACCRPAPLDPAIHEALVPHLGLDKFFDLLHARHDVWIYLRGLPSRGSAEGRAWADCYKKPEYCHTYERFRIALGAVCEVEKSWRKEMPPETFEHHFKVALLGRNTACSACAGALEERLHRWMGEGDIKNIMMPSPAVTPTKVSPSSSPSS